MPRRVRLQQASRLNPNKRRRRSATLSYRLRTCLILPRPALKTSSSLYTRQLDNIARQPREEKRRIKVDNLPNEKPDSHLNLLLNAAKAGKIILSWVSEIEQLLLALLVSYPYLIGLVKLKELAGFILAALLILLTSSYVLTGSIALSTIANTSTCALVWSVVSTIVLFLVTLPLSFAEFAFLGYLNFTSILLAILHGRDDYLSTFSLVDKHHSRMDHLDPSCNSNNYRSHCTFYLSSSSSYLRIYLSSRQYRRSATKQPSI
ncbi:hypothetical protein KC321_g59 [Hortaea werneckii]|nr:hypothetical protein KC321_g59 [Hortaea werneckii]